MKRTLPTVQRTRSTSRRRAERPVAPRERATPPKPLITIGYANHAREAGQLATKLCAALTARGVAVGALIVQSGGEPAAEVSVGSFLEAGAQAAKSVLVPASGAAEVLAEALERLRDPAVVVGIGNALALFYQPFFSIVVSGHRRQLIADDTQILKADLELTAPSDGLPDELAKILQSRLNAAPPP